MGGRGELAERRDGALRGSSRGRVMSEADLEQIRQLIRAHPDWSRRRLSERLEAEWNWRNGVGRLKDMATRSLLVKLDERGWIQLPPRRWAPTNRMRARRIAPRLWDRTPRAASLAELGRLEIHEVSGDAEGRQTLAAALAEFHYLGYTSSVGENAQYLITQGGSRVLGGVLFGSAAWKCRDRDMFIGWTSEARGRNLSRITNNARFLLLPWVHVPRLGSWVLGRVLRRLSADWQAKYGHPLALVEKFVERQRFRGTVYRAANWQHVGATQGRTRQDRNFTVRAPAKDIYVYPLARNFREILAHAIA
ncbi:MAG: Druantia anti-phage system protein DruA [Terriglobia bacterium]